MHHCRKRFAAHILYYDCDQFILRAIENCAPFVEKIYVAYSELPWQYNPKARQQYRNLADKEIIKQSRYLDKIELIEGVWAYEEEQRNTCLERAREEGFDYLIIHDADEFYSFADYRDNIAWIERNPDYELYRTPWCSFWKNLNYILLNKDGDRLLGYPEFAVNCRTSASFVRARTTNATKILNLKALCFHLSYVLTDEQVLRKINTWGHAHQFDTQRWYHKTWLGWHLGKRNLHPVEPEVWREAVSYFGELPEVLSDFVSPQVTTKLPSFKRILAGKLRLLGDRLQLCRTRFGLRLHRVKTACTWRLKATRLAIGPGLKLHLGCGERRYEDMLNCEYRPTYAADLIFDCSRLAPFADGSVVQVFSHAFFEHLYRPQQLPLLQDCFRVLTPDGNIIFLGIPDFEVIASSYLHHAPSHLISGKSFDLYHVYRYTHGDPEMVQGYWLEQLHKSLFDKSSLCRLLNDAGFVNHAIFNYCYPGEEIPLNLGFVASRSNASVIPQLHELLHPFRECVSDLRQIRLYHAGKSDPTGVDAP